MSINEICFVECHQWQASQNHAIFSTYTCALLFLKICSRCGVVASWSHNALPCVLIHVSLQITEQATSDKLNPKTEVKVSICGTVHMESSKNNNNSPVPKLYNRDNHSLFEKKHQPLKRF